MTIPKKPAKLMSRSALDRLNMLASVNSAKTYLEIGVCTGGNFIQVEVDSKTGVDPFFQFDPDLYSSETVVFVEVKYRKHCQHGSGAEAVTFQKQGRISRTAAWYLVQNPQRAEQICRFDVISIKAQQRGQSINWIKNAFYSTMI